MLRGVQIDDDMPQVDLTGSGIAHDLLEHQNGLGKIGTIVDELEALGALLFVRGIFGQLNRKPMYRSVEESLGMGDLSTMFERIGCRVEDMPTTVPVTRACDMDDSIAACIGHFSPQAALDQTDDEEQQRWIRAQVGHYKKLCLAHMRIGYRKVRRRWGNDNYKANRQFWAIADVVLSFAKSVEYEGRQFVLSYGNGEAFMREIEDDGSHF
jgi:hypothetical protein